MPSKTTVLLRSIRRWLLATTFLLGVTLTTIAYAGYLISGYNGEIVFGLSTVIGVSIAIFAAAAWLLGIPVDTPEETE